MTPIALSNLAILRDKRTVPTTEYVVMGGQVGADTLVVGPYPTPDAGRYLLIFLPGQRVQATPGQYARDVMLLNAALPIDSQNYVTFPFSNDIEPLSTAEAQLKACP